MQDKAAKMDTKRKAVISNDLADETELKEDLEDYEVAGDFLDETEEEEEDSNIDDATIKVASVIRTEQGC
jgi:putative NADH-flavin reductase